MRETVPLLEHWERDGAGTRLVAVSICSPGGPFARRLPDGRFAFNRAELDAWYEAERAG